MFEMFERQILRIDDTCNIESAVGVHIIRVVVHSAPHVFRLFEQLQPESFKMGESVLDCYELEVSLDGWLHDVHEGKDFNVDGKCSSGFLDKMDESWHDGILGLFGDGMLVDGGKVGQFN